MKKSILAIAVIATAAIAGWNYQQNQESVEMSDLTLENVEALARNEISSGYATKDCYNEWVGGMDGYMNRVCKCTGSGNILFCM